MFNTIRVFTVAAATTAALAGCGGGGGGGGVDSSIKLFLTDSFRDDYSQVWLAIHKVEFRDAATQAFHNAFDSPSGTLVDAKRLRDGSGEKFALLANGNLPAGTYDAIRVTFRNEAVLVPTGSTIGETRVFADAVPRDASNRPTVTYQLNPSISVPSDKTVIDIDLASFVVGGDGKVTPSLRRGDETGFGDINRHEIEDYKGTVSGLTSTSFMLNMNGAGPVPVRYSANTEIYRENTGGAGTLANGQLVEADARWDSAANALIAYRIKIEDGNSSNEAEAEGGVTNVNLGANTMVLENIDDIENFVPQGSTVNVVWTDTTVFRRSGTIVDESWLPNFLFAEVKGTYNAGTNTISATRITLEDDGTPGEGEAEATGDISNPNSTTNTMMLLNIREIEGFTPQGSSVTVTWTDGVTIFRRSGDIVQESEIFNWPIAEAKGTYNPGTNTITASRITLDNN